MAARLHIICYDLPTVSRFFRSVALSVALEQHATMQWQTSRANAVLNTIHAVLFWKEPPGSGEILTGTQVAIERTTDLLHERYLQSWIRKVSEKGPIAGNEYVALMSETRRDARIGLQQVFHGAGEINANVVHRVTDAITTLARIRLGSRNGVAMIGGAVGVLAVPTGGAGVSILGMKGEALAGMGLMFATSTSMIRNWEEGEKAQVAAIASEIGKYAESEGGGKLADNKLVAALSRQGNSAEILKAAQIIIKRASERLAVGALGKKTKATAGQKSGQSAAQIASEAAKSAKAGTAVKMAVAAGKSIPVVFSKIDIFGAIEEAGETADAE